MNVTEFKGRLNYNYVFNYTDHLGNIRLSYATDPTTATLKVIEENHYYPFGLKHTNYNSDRLTYVKREENLRIGQIGITPILIDDVRGEYKYKYNGKEYQDELGLNMYDYGARNYDPAIGRWMNVDPLAENSRRWTPYNYAYNNPIFFVDPDGMQAESGNFKSIDEEEEAEIRKLTKEWLDSDGNDDWIKKKGTNSYFWDQNVNSEGNTPEGYEYVGKKYKDVLSDFESSNNWFLRALGYAIMNVNFESFYSAKYKGMIDRIVHKGGITPDYIYDFSRSLLHKSTGNDSVTFDIFIDLKRTGESVPASITILLAPSNKVVLDWDNIGTVAGPAGRSVNNAIVLQGIGSADSRSSYSARYPIAYIEFSNKETLQKVYQYMLSTTSSYIIPAK